MWDTNRAERIVWLSRNLRTKATPFGQKIWPGACGAKTAAKRRLTAPQADGLQVRPAQASRRGWRNTPLPRRRGAPARRRFGSPAGGGEGVRGRGGAPSPGTARRTVVIEGHGGLEVGKSPASRSLRTTRRRRQRTAREADCRERRVAPRRCRGAQGCETSPSARRTVVKLPEGTPAARASQNLGTPHSYLGRRTEKKIGDTAHVVCRGEARA